MTTRPSDIARLIDKNWPVDGPHHTERLDEAVWAISQLIRYANHATLDDQAIKHAPDLYPVAGNLTAAAAGLEQLCRQLSQRCQGFATDPTLRHDHHRDNHDEAQRAARATAGAFQTAGRLAVQLTAEFSAAHNQIARLYHEMRTEPDPGRTPLGRQEPGDEPIVADPPTSTDGHRRSGDDSESCTDPGCASGVLTLHYILDDDRERVMRVACSTCRGTDRAATGTGGRAIGRWGPSR